MTQRNVELAYKTLDYIEAHPKEWYQGAWYHKTVCGTRACFAGWAVILAGGRIIDIAEDKGWRSPAYRARLTESDELGYIEEKAVTALGIDDWRAGMLFDAANSFYDLKRYVEHVFGPRPC